MLKRLGLVAVTLCLMAAPPAFAGAFVGASVLDTTVESDVSGSGSDFDGSDTGYKIYGGFDFFKFFRIEGSYLDLGSPDDSVGGTDIQADITAFDAFAVLVIPLGKRFEIFGKAGVFMWDTEFDFSGAVSGSDDDSGTDPAYGVGAAFKLGEHFAIRGEYEIFDVDDIDTLDAISLGLDFRF